MAEFPALPLFTDAYLGDTTHLTTIEHGAYLLLLMVSWRSRECCVPDDDKMLARFTRMTVAQWGRIRPTIIAFFEAENGVLIQRRLRDEFNHVRQVRESQIANGKASALKRKGRHSTKRKPSVNRASTPSPSPSPTPIDSPDGESSPTPFEQAWSEFVEFRRKIGKPMTDHSIKLALGKLDKFLSQGQDPVEIIHQSILNGWSGLFEVKENRNGNGNSDGLSTTERALRNVLADHRSRAA